MRFARNNLSALFASGSISYTNLGKTAFAYPPVLRDDALLSGLGMTCGVGGLPGGIMRRALGAFF